MDTITSVLKRRVSYGLIFCMFLLLGACASTKPPTERLTKTEVAIKQAEQVGAGEFAPLEIREARKKLARAKELSDKGDHEKAGRLADQAEVDAELAEAKALSEKAQNAVTQLRESIRILQEEIQRKQ